MNAKDMMRDRLLAGETIENYREGGNSMVPLIYSRQPVDIAPVDTELVTPGDIVFCKVKGRYFTHLVLAEKLDSVLIGNNHGHANGWAKRNNIYGIITHVDGVERPKTKEKVK